LFRPLKANLIDNQILIALRIVECAAAAALQRAFRISRAFCAPKVCAITFFVAVDDAIAAGSAFGTENFALMTNQVAGRIAVVLASLTAKFWFVAFFTKLKHCIETYGRAIGVVGAVAASGATAIAFEVARSDLGIGTGQVAVAAHKLVKRAGIAVIATRDTCSLDIAGDGRVTDF
jgi:hypothetical protein